ncbi:OmpA family protein [Aquiflexum sp. TKW24L]|uniref:OmpA family protein n=1 Tax=Aquiflexum sp. TKW24L TaxID=2942212 RepID=UPI0020BDB544|nr:OmpA family protein [Aquiflexum sp. TKW24L]MCL6260301.1 OmpA family protein [Aquiflexum sp. TKW24L]
MKIRTLTLILTFFCLYSTTYSQQKEYKWRIGASGGYTNYYGDLTPYRLDGLYNWEANRHLFYYNDNYAAKPSYKIYLEKQLSTTIGLMLNYGNYHFGMSDRYVQRDGELYTDNPNFTRGLNFQNHTRDLGLSLVFKTDNDKFLSSSSLIAPYFTVGLGYIRFDVKGDLLDGDGQRYDQNLPGIIHDGIYETNLPDWNTELVNGYDQDSWYANFGLGFRVRLGSRVEFFAQSDFLHTFTNFLDDASGRYRMEYDNDFQAYAAKPGTNVIDPNSPYRGHPDEAKDWIIYHGIGLKFNFGASKKTFTAPRLSSYNPNNSVSLKEALKSNQDYQDSLLNRKSGVTNNFFYTVQLIETKRLDSLAYATKILGFEQEIQKRETRILESQTAERRLLGISGTFDSQYDSLEKENRLDPREKQDLLQASQKARFDIRYSIDSLNRRQQELLSEIDSIANLKRNLPLEQRVLVFPDPDSLFQKQVMVSDSIVQSNTRTFAAAEQESTKSFQAEKIESDQAESAPTAMAAAPPVRQSNERMTQVEQENQYLKSERDRILREYNDYLKSGKPKREKPRYIENTRTIQRENTNTVYRDEPQRRRRWWWPFAAAGGVATAIALSDNDEGDNQNTPIDSAAIVQEFLGREDMIFAVSSALLGVDLRNNVKQEKSLLEVPETLLAVETITDTVYVDNKAVTNLIKSKEILYFKLNQKVPDAEETAKLAELAGFIKENEEYRLLITGFADNTGNVNFNLKLAEQRMNSVAELLRSEFGLAEDQLRLESGGQVIRGNRQAANDLDRRVEVRTERR